MTIDYRSVTTYAILFLPMLLGYGANLGNPIDSKAGADIPARPPSQAFGIVWPVLYLLIGFAWLTLRAEQGTRTDVLFGVLVALLTAWTPVYGRGYTKRALYVILLATTASLATFGHAWSTDANSGLLMTPLVGWLMFATSLNMAEVNAGSDHS